MSAESSTLLPASWEVPSVLRQRLGRHPGKQRAMKAEGHLLLVLHAPPTADHELREGRFFWRNPQGKWAPAAMHHGQHALDELLDEYDRVLDELQEAFQKAEAARDYFNLFTRLNPLVRSLRHAHEALQSARESTPDDRQLIVLRDRAYAMVRAAELLQDDTKFALEFEQARREEEQAASAQRMAVSAHRLNVLVACFFPVATLAAIFGMNLRHGLEEVDETSGPWPLTAIVLGALASGFLLSLFITRKPRRP
ncbi:MAG: hypothetical protein KF847_15520 [Pirellulales bacterium]|nr:hypothetical protein [Pirellulales bacterium]